MHGRKNIKINSVEKFHESTEIVERGSIQGDSIEMDFKRYIFCLSECKVISAVMVHVEWRYGSTPS